MLKVTADTNIYISALNFGGKPLQLLDLARSARIELAISNAIITEMSRILYNKFHWRREDVGDAVDQLLGFTKYVHPDETIEAVPADPDDNHTLECAVKAGSEIIVSGDAHLLTLRTFRGIDIMRVSDLLDRVVT